MNLKFPFLDRFEPMSTAVSPIYHVFFLMGPHYASPAYLIDVARFGTPAIRDFQHLRHPRPFPTSSRFIFILDPDVFWSFARTKKHVRKMRKNTPGRVRSRRRRRQCVAEVAERMPVLHYFLMLVHGLLGFKTRRDGTIETRPRLPILDGERKSRCPARWRVLVLEKGVTE